MAEDGEQRQGAVATGSVAPGTLTALLREVARAPEEELGGAWEQALRPGAVVGRFELVVELGRGGFGVVWEARDRELGRAVAFKAVRAGAQTAAREQRLLLEAEAAARLAHPNIVMLYDLGRCEHGPYLVLERLHGETLAERLRRGPVAPAEAVRIASEITEGLAHAHGHGVVHRDLKPANVFLCQDGQVKLLDFGLAQAFGRERAAGGTSGYMAPEQEAGREEDARADVYALGATLHEMMAGERPPAPLPAGIPSALAKLTARCLSADPAGRPVDGQALLEELFRAERSLRRPKEARRWALRIGLGIALGAAAAGLAVWRTLPRGVVPGPDGRITVAVADFANETKDPELDGLSGLLITALEQSRALHVLTRSRMSDLAVQMGKGRVERIDESLAREVGKKAGVQALLLASVRKFDDVYAVEMRALHPETDEYLFTEKEQVTGKRAIPEVVDRLSERTRRWLRAGDAEVSRARGVASITTPNMKAWDLLFRAQLALEHDREMGDYGEARKLVEAALEVDPDFALAHYLLAVVAFWASDGRANDPEVLRRIQAAERFADRLPEKERLSLLAMRAQVQRRLDEARRLRDQLVENYPMDKEAQFYAGDVRIHQGEPEQAVPYFLRALRLDPEYIGAAEHLVAGATTLGRAAELLEGIRPQTLKPVQAAHGLLAAGREAEAVDVLEQAPAPRYYGTYLYFLALNGRAAEAEALLNSGVVKGTDSDLRFQRHVILASQGRYAEAESLPAEGQPEPKGLVRRAICRLDAATIGRSASGVRTAVEELARLGAFEYDKPRPYPPWRLAGDVYISPLSKIAMRAAVLLAVFDDVATAGSLATRFPPGQDSDYWRPTSHSAEGLAAWASGSPELAEERFRTVASNSHIGHRYVGLVLLGTLARERGRCAEAAEALEKARALPWPAAYSVRLWTHPAVLGSLAGCYERMGELDKAWERNDELLRFWARADPRLPLLIEAKARQRRLAQAARQ